MISKDWEQYYYPDSDRVFIVRFRQYYNNGVRTIFQHEMYGFSSVARWVVKLRSTLSIDNNPAAL